MLQDFALQMTDLTMRMFVSCQEREMYFVSQYGIRVAEFRCLRHLLRHEFQSIKKLAAAMNVTPGRLTRILDDLIKKELVLRVETKSDRRMKIVSLTKEGRKLAESMEKNYVAMHRDILKKIPAESYQEVLAATNRLLDAMEAWSKDSRRLAGSVSVDCRE